jgi:hypothetical protein
LHFDREHPEPLQPPAVLDTGTTCCHVHDSRGVFTANANDAGQRAEHTDGKA